MRLTLLITLSLVACGRAPLLPFEGDVSPDASGAAGTAAAGTAGTGGAAGTFGAAGAGGAGGPGRVIDLSCS
jgi:hypothetical protein